MPKKSAKKNSKKTPAKKDLSDIEGDVILIDEGLGIIRFVGKIPGKKGVSIGVELVEGEGDCDGTFGGRQWFKCKPQMGIFIQQKQIKKTITPAALLKKIGLLNDSLLDCKMHVNSVENKIRVLEEENSNLRPTIDCQVINQSGGATEYEDSESVDGSAPPSFQEPTISVDNTDLMDVNTATADNEISNKKVDEKESELDSEMIVEEDITYVPPAQPLPSSSSSSEYDRLTQEREIFEKNRINTETNLDIREAEVNEQMMQVEKRLKLLGEAIAEKIDKEQLTQDPISRVNKWVEKMRIFSVELAEKEHRNNLREKRLNDMNKELLEKEKSLATQDLELQKTQQKIENARRIIGEMKEQRLKWTGMIEKNRSEFDLCKDECQKLLIVEKANLSTSIARFENNMKEIFLEESNMIKEEKDELQRKIFRLDAREEQVKIGKQELDEAREQFLIDQEEVLTRLKETQEGKTKLEAEKKEFKKKSSQFAEEYSKFVTDKKLFDKNNAELTAEMKKLRSQQKTLIKSENENAQRLKKITEKEVYLEQKEKEIDELDLQIKLEQKLCLKEQKKLKRMQKKMVESKDEFNALRESTMKDKLDLETQTKKYTKDFKTFIYAKKKQDQKLKNAKCEKENSLKIIKQKERELDERQQQLLQDAVRGDVYEDFVQIRAKLRDLTSNNKKNIQKQKECYIENREVQLNIALEEFQSEKKDWEQEKENDFKEIENLKQKLEKECEKQRRHIVEIENLKLDLEGEKERAAFEKEHYQKMRDKYSQRTNEINDDLIKIHTDFDASTTLKERNKYLEDIQKEISSERDFLNTQNQKFKSKIKQITAREQELKDQISKMEKEKNILRDSYSRLEAKNAKKEKKEEEAAAKKEMKKEENKKNNVEKEKPKLKRLKSAPNRKSIRKSSGNLASAGRSMTSRGSFSGRKSSFDFPDLSQRRPVPRKSSFSYADSMIPTTPGRKVSDKSSKKIEEERSALVQQLEMMEREKKFTSEKNYLKVEWTCCIIFVLF